MAASMFLVEGGGEVKVKHAHIESDIIEVDQVGIITAEGQGWTAGPGAGQSSAGAGHGGRGSASSSSGKAEILLGQNTIKLVIFCLVLTLSCFNIVLF